ncbi:MAG: hypothetical protein HQL48_03070 [Gammaproteobacteria bacterium]|nr:hypothetical protein [Gammaproteobacteria bacterium]
MGVSAPLYAGDYDISLDGLAGVQDDFLKLSEDLGAALSYKALAPVEPLGSLGFDIGIEMSSSAVANSDVWKKVTGEDISNLPVPRVHLHKGLPLNVDIAASYATIPASDITLFAWELRYAFMEGNIALPAVAIRYTQSNLSGVEQLSFSTRGVELGISKGFAMATPYAGVGQIWVDSGASIAALKDESFSMRKLFVGLNFNLGLMNLAVEGDKTGEVTSYGGKISFRF